MDLLLSGLGGNGEGMKKGTLPPRLHDPLPGGPDRPAAGAGARPPTLFPLGVLGRPVNLLALPGGLVGELLAAGAIVVGTGVVFFVAGSVLRRVARRAGAQPATLDAIRNWLLLLWGVAAFYLVATATGFTSLLSLLTFSGVIGLIISLALQNTLTNIICGLLLITDGALRTGDQIEYSGTKGKVVRIALRNTWVLTDGGAIAVIGNASLAGGPLVNHSARSRVDHLIQGKEGTKPTSAPDAAKAPPPKGS